MAESALTFPVRAGEVKKGTFVVIKGKPCKCVEVTTSKTGKHGHAKANITALDIFTNKKYEDICPTSHNMEAPFVSTQTYQVIDINDENFMTMLDSEGETREDLAIDADDETHRTVKSRFEEEGEVFVVVTKAMGIQRVTALSTGF